MGDTLIIDLWGDHYYTEKSTVIYLNPGKYTLTLYYYDRTGHAKVSFYADPDVLTWTETEYKTTTEYVITTIPYTTTNYVVNIEYTSVTNQRTVVDDRFRITGLIIAAVGTGMTLATVGVLLRARKSPQS